MSTTFLCVIFLWGTGSLSAEIVHFRDGGWLQGEIVRHDENRFVLERWDTGGVITIGWERVTPEDRKRIQKRLGYIVEEDLDEKVRGNRYFMKDGNVREGVYLSDRSTSTHLAVKTRSGVLMIVRENVKSSREIQLSATKVYTPAELYKEKLAGLDPQSAQDHYRISEFLVRLGNAEKAREHLERAMDLDGTYRERFAGKLQVLVEGIEKRKIERRFDQILSAARAGRYDEARSLLQALIEETSNHPELLSRDPQEIAQKIEALRDERLVDAVPRKMVGSLRRLAARSAKARGTTFAEASSYATGALGEGAKSEVAQELSLDSKEVDRYLSERTKRYTFRISFGSASFIVGTEGTSKGGLPGGKGEKPATLGEGLNKDIDEIKKLIEKIGGPMLSQRGGSSQGRGKSQGRNSGRSADPKEDWWTRRSSSNARRDLMIGLYAIKNFEVVRNVWTACSSCAGKGYRVFLNTGGGGARNKVCTRCYGMRYDRTVVFR